jgi:hypothetical protein
MVAFHGGPDFEKSEALGLADVLLGAPHDPSGIALRHQSDAIHTVLAVPSGFPWQQAPAPLPVVLGHVHVIPWS